MIHFTLSVSSDITGCQCLLFVYLESGGRFKFKFKFGFEIEIEIEIEFELGGFFEEFFFK